MGEKLSPGTVPGFDVRVGESFGRRLIASPCDSRRPLDPADLPRLLETAREQGCARLDVGIAPDAIADSAWPGGFVAGWKVEGSVQAGLDALMQAREEIPSHYSWHEELNQKWFSSAAVGFSRHLHDFPGLAVLPELSQAQLESLCRKFLDSGETLCLADLNSDMVLGVMHWFPEPEKQTATGQFVWVNPEARGRTLGRILLGAAMGRCREQGLERYDALVDVANLPSLQNILKLGGRIQKLMVSWSEDLQINASAELPFGSSTKDGESNLDLEMSQCHLHVQLQRSGHRLLGYGTADGERILLADFARHQCVSRKVTHLVFASARESAHALA